jgi:hypothetical protein
MQRILEDPEFSFNELKSEKTSTGIKVNIELTANDAINTGTTLHVAIVEKGVTINNSSAIYKNVLRKLMPDPAGTSYANWHLRQTEKIELSWNYFNITNPDSIRVIAFIQDDVTKEVYQAATDSLTFHTKKGIEAVVSKDSTFSLYPNPAKSLLNIIFEKPLCTVSTVQVYNQLGELVKSANIEKGTQIKQINIDALKGGLYFIRVNANGQLYRTEKLVILR